MNGESLAKWLDSMLKHRVITLEPDGAFTAPVAGAMCHLIFDGDADRGRWLLVDVPSDGRQDSLLSVHHDLDRGLEALAVAAGWSGQRFRVEVGADTGFIRPGKVTAAEIMAGMGFRLVRSVVCFAILEPKTGLTVDQARSEFVRRLAGRGLIVGNVDPVGPPDLSWCADVAIPYEGYIHTDDVGVLVEGCLSGSGLEIADEDGSATLDFATPHVADVMPFPVAA